MTITDLDWRKLETAIIACARRAEWDTDENTKTGDKIVYIDLEVPPINATEFAKDLAKELGL